MAHVSTLRYGVRSAPGWSKRSGRSNHLCVVGV